MDLRAPAAVKPVPSGSGEVSSQGSKKRTSSWAGREQVHVQRRAGHVGPHILLCRQLGGKVRESQANCQQLPEPCVTAQAATADHLLFNMLETGGVWSYSNRLA